MRRKICIGLLTLCIIFLQLLNPFSNANAIVYNTSNYKSITSASVIFRNGGSVPFTMNSSTGGAYANVTGFGNSSGFYYLGIGFAGTIPARSLLVVNVETRFSNSYPQMGWTTRSGAYSLLNASYGDYGSESLVFYVDQDITGEIDLFPTVQDSAQTSQLFMTISPISYTTLSFEPTWDQLNEISAKLTTSNGNLQLIRGKLDDIATLLEEQNEAQQEQQEQEQEDRDNIEQQSSSTETEANEQGDEATQTGTSLFNAFTQLLGALTNVNGNSCTLPAMQVYSLNLGNMNLCQYDIPPQIMALVSIGMVFIIIPLGINLVKRMISLYKEITG